MMTNATAAFYDVSFFDGRIVSLGDCRRLMRRIAGNAAVGLAAAVAVGLLIVTVTLAAAWIVNTFSGNPLIHASAPMGPGTLALADAPDVSFADKWARATASMQARAVPLATPQTQVAKLSPAEAPDSVPIAALPLPPKRPVEMAIVVPLPRSDPAQREIALAPASKIAPPAPPRVTAAAPPAPAEKRVATREVAKKSRLLPGPDSRTAVYDIEAHTVYLPNGERLEAHSGLGDKLDDPRYVKVRMRGPTPPNVYELALREELFHGVRALRLNPINDDKMFGRDGMLAHTYMLGPNGQSNGCVSFKDYQKFLNAYLNGEVNRLVVVAHLDDTPSRVAYEQRGRAERYAANY
jgi:Tlde1 domain